MSARAIVPMAVVAAAVAATVFTGGAAAPAAAGAAGAATSGAAAGTTAASTSFLAANAGAIAAASSIASVAATGYSMYSQQQQAKAEASAQSQRNQEMAVQAASSYDDLSPAAIDANRQAQDAALQQQAEAIQAKGRVNVFAAASGTLGGSVDSMLYDIDRQKSQNLNSILTQRESGLFSIKQQAESIRQGAISGQSRQAIQSPGWLETGLAVGTAAVKGFDNYGRMKDTLELRGKATQPQVKGGV